MGFLSRLLGRPRDAPRAATPPTQPSHVPGAYSRDVGEGYSISFNERPNGFGGYHFVDYTLHHEGRGLHVPVTDSAGAFVAFPGADDGAWRQFLEGDLTPAVEFASRWGTFQNGLLSFSWTVQPDGMYWMDEDGFGMEDDEEIVLVSELDERGEFVRPFGPSASDQERFERLASKG